MKQWFGKLMTTAFVLFSLCLTVWAEEAQAVAGENERQNLTFHVDKVSKTYDGKAIDFEWYYYIDGRLFGFNYVKEIEFTVDNVTTAGTYSVSVKSVKIYNIKGEDVTKKNYNITYAKESDNVVIKQRPITIASSDDAEDVPESATTKVTYDGKPHALDKVAVDEDEGKGLARGDTLTASVADPSPITNAGTKTYAVGTYAIKNGAGNDVTASYNVKTVNNALQITQRKLKVYPIRKDGKYTRDYNGEGFLPDGWNYMDRPFNPSDRLAEGDSLVPVYIPDGGYSMLTNVGTSVYRTDDAKTAVTNAAGETVTGSYDIDGDPSWTFTVEPADVTIKSKTAETWYTGKPFSCHEFETFKGFAPGEGFAETNNWASQTEIGSCLNFFTYKLKSNTLPTNYNIETNYGGLVVFEGWRVKYDLAGGDFVTNDQAWKLQILESENADKISTNVKLVLGEAPVRDGYEFLGWTNAVMGALYQPNEEYTFKISSDVRPFELTALWDAYGQPTVTPTTTWDDKIQWFKTLDGAKQTTKSLRDVTIENTSFQATKSLYYSPMTNALIVQVRIKAPKFIATEERAKAVRFNVDGIDFEQGAPSPIGYEYPTVKFHAAEPGVTEEYYYIEWYAYVRPGQMNKALADNEEIGTAFGDTKLYCDWNNDGEFDTGYTIKFDADSCTLYNADKMVFPLVQELVWKKGYLPYETKSEVTKESWDEVLKYKFYTNTVDLAKQKGVNDLVRTGYVQQAWSPEVTRGYAVLMKDTTFETNVVEMTAQWEANEYDADLVLDKDGVTIDPWQYTIPTDWTVEELPFDLPTPEQVISEREVWGLDYWTNQFGKAVTKIDLESVGTNDVDEVPFGAVLTGIVYKVDYIMTNGFANIDKPGTPYQSVNENITQYSAETNGGKAVFLKDASCFGCRFDGWETKIKTEAGDKWIPVSSFSTTRGGDKLFRAKWTEYQAMVVERDTATTNYFTVVADAIKAVKNSNTTIAFLDAKGDGIQDPVQIKIPADLKGIAVNFCTLSYTNATGEAALDIGDKAEVCVQNLPGFIGLEGASMSRLVQTNGYYAVKVGEGATFKLDDKNMILDVDDREYDRIYTELKDREYQYYDAKAVISYTILVDTWREETFGLVAFTNAVANSGGLGPNIFWSDEFKEEGGRYEGVTYERFRYDTNPIIVTNRQTASWLTKTIVEELAKASNEWAKVQFYTNAVTIVAPESAKLELKAGNIGGALVGKYYNAASIYWENHLEYLDSKDLNFETHPRQDRVVGVSQVKPGYIWTTNGVENTEFPFTITKLGPVSKEATTVAPGNKIESTKATVKGVFQVDSAGSVTNSLFEVLNPTGVNDLNSEVVNGQTVSANATMTHTERTSVFAFGYMDKHMTSFNKMLVETMEQRAPTNVVVSYDWDGVAAGSANAYTYTLTFDANKEGDIIVSNATQQLQLFPFVAKITYTQPIELIETNKLASTYTIYDTIRAPGLKLEPEIGSCYTTKAGETYRFDGWYDGSTLVTNLIHETGVGQSDVRDITLEAEFNKVVWDAISPDGKTTNKCASVQEAIDKLPNGGDIRFFGKPEDAALQDPIEADAGSAKCGFAYTIDLNGATFTNAPSFQGEYLFEIAGKCTEVTIQNGTIGFETTPPTNARVVPGGVRASDEAKVTLANTLTVKTDKTMVCADDGSFVTVDGAKLANQGAEAGVTAYDEATLVFTNVAAYLNRAYAYNAEIRVYNSKIAPDIKGEIGVLTPAITAQDGAEVYLGYHTEIVNNGDLQSIILLDSKLTVDDPVTYHTEDIYTIPDWQTISNERGAAIYASAGTFGTAENAEIDLRRGYIWSNAQAVQLHAGKLTATNVVEGVDGVKAVSRGATLLISNDLGLLNASDISLWSGMYESVNGEALLSSNGESGEKFNILSNFVNCALLQQPVSAGIKNIKKGAIFSSGVRKAYLAPGYMACTDDELIEESGTFWHFVKTIPYKIDYDLNGGTRTQGEDVWKTSYNVEDDIIMLPSNTVQKANWYFSGWSNTVTGAMMDKIVPGKDFGDIALIALWRDKPSTVYVDYQGADAYPKYTRHYNPETRYYWWTPSDRYAYPNHRTGEDGGKEVTPSKGVTFEAPTYKGFTFINFEDVNTGRKYNAGQEYGILDFTFDKDAKVHLRGVWASDMVIVDEDGNKYVTIEDALKAAKENSTLKVVGDGMVFTNKTESTIVIDKNVTLDLNGKALAIPEGFTGDTLVMITNAPSAKVINGGLAGTTADAAIAPIKVVKDEQPVKALDASWNLLFAVQIPEDYIKVGYKCVFDEEQGVWYIDSIENKLTFAAGDPGVRPDLTVTLNNENRTFTCEDDPIALNDAKRDGYDFLGWWDGSKLITDGIFNPKGVTTSVTLTAQWKTIVYDIEYVVDEGSVVPEPSFYDCETPEFTLPTPTRAGNEFVGWRLNGAEPKKDCKVNPLGMTVTSTPPLGKLTAVAVWKDNFYTITFDTLGGKAITALKYNEDLVENGAVEIPAAEKVGCQFVKWIDEQGNEVPTGKVTKCFSAKLTAVYERSLWTGDTSVLDGNLEGDGRGQYFTGGVSYTGWLTDNITGMAVGKVTVTASKPTLKGLCTITMTTSTILGEGKTYTVKNTAVEITGEPLYGVVLGTVPNAIISISNNGVTGQFGTYTITASADRFSTDVTKVPAATLAYLQGNWTLAFQSAERCHGATTLKLSVSAKGKVSISGNLGDGTAVSTTSQLVYGDGTVVCPVVINAYTGKKGGFAFNLWLSATGAGDNLHDEIDITDMSDLIDAAGEVICSAEDVVWTATRVAETETQPSYVFGTDLTDFDAPATASGYLPYEQVIPDATNVSFTADVLTGKFTLPRASTVKIDATTGDVTFTNPNKDGKVNDIGLALTYTPSTGAVTGSMKVYFKAQNIRTGKWILKTVTAKVYGVMVGNFACCAAAENTIGSAPANLVSGRLLNLQDCGAIAIGGSWDGVILVTTAIYGSRAENGASASIFGARAANGTMVIVAPWIAK